MKSFIPTYYPRDGHYFFNFYNSLKRTRNKILYDATPIITEEGDYKHFRSYIKFDREKKENVFYKEDLGKILDYKIYQIETNSKSSEPLVYEVEYDENYMANIISTTSEISSILPSAQGRFLVEDLNKEDELDETSTPMIYIYIQGKINTDINMYGDGYYDEVYAECSPDTFPNNNSIKVTWSASGLDMGGWTFVRQYITINCSWNEQTFTSSNSNGSCTFSAPSDIQIMDFMPTVYLNWEIVGKDPDAGQDEPDPDPDDPYNPQDDYSDKTGTINNNDYLLWDDIEAAEKARKGQGIDYTAVVVAGNLKGASCDIEFKERSEEGYNYFFVTITSGYYEGSSGYIRVKAVTINK